MAYGEKIESILRAEDINLKEFSDLTKISYSAMRSYRKNRYNLSVKQISKICSIPRFAKYRELLLSVDMPTEDGPIGVKAPSPEAYKARELLEKLEKVGRLDEANEIMETLIKRAEKQ